MIWSGKKRERRRNTRLPEISFLVEAFTHGEMADYQMSAWLMAVVCAGMSDRGDCRVDGGEMMHSGRVLDLAELPGVKGDKHSTGGVGDKTALGYCADRRGRWIDCADD